MRFTGSCHNWCMAAMGTLVTFLLYSAVVFYVVIIADSLHWILVTVHRYTASRDFLLITRYIYQFLNFMYRIANQAADEFPVT